MREGFVYAVASIGCQKDSIPHQDSDARLVTRPIKLGTGMRSSWGLLALLCLESTHRGELVPCGSLASRLTFSQCPTMPLGKLPELGHHCLILGVVPPPSGGGRPQRPVGTSPPEPTGLSA